MHSLDLFKFSKMQQEHRNGGISVILITKKLDTLVKKGTQISYFVLLRLIDDI
jgi:hypothetical protein